MSTRTLRLPERLLRFIVDSKDYADWLAGRGVLILDRPLFAAVRDAHPRKDGSLHLTADPALTQTIHRWAIELTRAEGASISDTRANVRSGRSVIRQITPREFG